MKRFIKNNRADMNMVNAGIMLIVLLVVLYVGINILDNVQEATDVSEAVAATGTLTLTDVTADAQNVTIDGVTFEFDTNLTASEITAGNVEVDIADTAAATATVNLTAAITANATTAAKVTAASTTTTVTLTAATAGTAGNAYTTTENMANATWGAATLTGGSQSGVFYTTQQSLIDTTNSSYSMAGIMPIVLIAVAVLGGLLGVLYLFGRRE